jgi:hypothetical protein
MGNVAKTCWSIVGLIGATCAHAHAWTRGYVVEWYEPAFYYGAKQGVSAPGTDCPAGTNPELDWRKVLKTAYRTDADVDKILNPEDPQRAKVGGIRGPNKENVYEQPWSIPDPGLVGVSGVLAYGFNIDGDESTGFNGFDGEKGIDNEYYRAIGCFKAWRGPTREGHHAKYVNDGMRDGRYSVLIVISGNGEDWRNDPNVRVGFYLSKDKMVKDANGEIAHDYTFRINPDKRFQSVVAARTVNGVVETLSAADIVTRSLDGLPLALKEGRLRFEIQRDEKLVGFIGGYRSIDDYYAEWAAGGSIFELTMHINIPAYWYALQRSADGLFNPETGRYTAISSAFRYYAVPALIVAPDADRHVTDAKIFDGEVEPDARALALARLSRDGADANAAPQPAVQNAASQPQPRLRRVALLPPPANALPPQKKAPPASYMTRKADASSQRAAL